MTPQDERTPAEEIRWLRQEVNDLRLLLEAATGHSDGVEADLLAKVRQTIRESESKFRLITEAIPLPLLITRPTDDAILYANGPLGALLGIPSESLPDRKGTDFYDPAERPVLLEIMAEKGRIKGRELKIQDDRGTELWAELYVEPMTFENEDCFLVILRDTTRQRILEKQLRQSQKMEAIGTLARGIAHDFNNILGVIIGYAELASELVPENTPISDYLEKQLTGCSRARELIRQILTFSRQTEQRYRPVSVRSVIREVVDFLRSSLPSTITIFEEIGSEVRVLGDPTQIYQVLLNLCTNAAHAMQTRGGILVIGLMETKIDPASALLYPHLESGDYIRIVVKDTGCGMTPEVLKQIFDPFYTTKPVGEGTGLGLSVVHGIVRDHGGAVSAESQSEKGTAFEILLPALAPKETPEPQRREKEGENEGLRILLVEDDPLVAEMASEQLASLGHAVTRTMNSNGALSLFRSAPARFDLVITDMTMPEITGDRLSAEMMKIRPDIPIILASGKGFIREEEVLKTGIRVLLAKPFLKVDMAAAIRNAMTPMPPDG